MKEVMTNKEIIQYEIDALTPFMSIEVLEADDSKFLAKYNEYACTETEIDYKLTDGKLAVNYLDKWTEANGCILMELIFENTLQHMETESDFGGIKIKSTEFSPKFTRLMSEYKAMTEAEQESDAGRRLFLDVMRSAPQSFQDMAFNKAKEMGLAPDASGYLENGECVYSLQDIAELHGITIDEALELAKEMGIDVELISPDDVHRIN